MKNSLCENKFLCTLFGTLTLNFGIVKEFGESVRRARIRTGLRLGPGAPAWATTARDLHDK